MIDMCTDKGRVVHKATTPTYHCTYYDIKLNIFSFAKASLRLPFTVIAPPASVDRTGYCGSLADIITDFQKHRGTYLALNLTADDIRTLPDNIASGKTLPTCVFDNTFPNFDVYLSALRHSHRRRIKKAMERARSLDIAHIPHQAFDEHMYTLYLNVLNNSSYPLETLPIEFFRSELLDTYTLRYNEQTLAFVSLFYDKKENELNFIFGGMDYSKLKEYDLYYNMLIAILKKGMELQVSRINLGQTAEYAKCFVGARLEERYMICFSSNSTTNFLIKKFSFLLENSNNSTTLHPFK